MKAYVLHDVNKLIYEDIPIPTIDKEWALVEVKAAGVCGSDISRIFETGTYHFPTIPGHEFSGIVRCVGDEKYKDMLDKRVGIFPLIPCKECFSCKEGNYEMCCNYSYLGSRTDGGFAEYVAVPIWNLIMLPEEVSNESAAMLEPTAVALHAVKRVNITNGDVVTIYGAGPIGLIMAQFARNLGASKVLIITNKEEQGGVANKLGFKYICNSKKQDPVKWIFKNTDNQGSNVIIEGVGTSQVLSDSLKGVRPNGTILAVGNPKDNYNLDKNVYWQLLRKQIKIIGTWNSSYNNTEKNDWASALKAMKEKKIETQALITHKLSFDNLLEGLLIMKEKKEFYCKVMITKGD